MKITILGCGSSLGVPVIGCKCEVCESDNPYNKRLRSSILIQHENTNIIVDTTPDFRSQALRNKISHIDAVFYTHAHADHIAGIDDLRAFNFIQQSKIFLYADYQTLDYLKENYSYAFKEDSKVAWARPSFLTNIIKFQDKIDIESIRIEVFEQIHGKIKSLGLKINDKVAYSTDVSELPSDSMDLLRDIDIWIVDCLSENISEGHANLLKVLEWVEKIKPKKVILTHLSHNIDYKKISRKLPLNVCLAYDGMNIII